MKQFNYKIHFAELSNKNSYYEVEYEVAEIYIKTGGGGLYIARVHGNVVETQL
jgi:hypothetical protein